MTNDLIYGTLGCPVTADGVGLTYDALGRMVEQNRSGVYTEIVYGPGGEARAHERTDFAKGIRSAGWWFECGIQFEWLGVLPPLGLARQSPFLSFPLLAERYIPMERTRLSASPMRNLGRRTYHSRE